MPLLRFDLIEGRDEKSIKKLLDAGTRPCSSHSACPREDRYQVVHQHPAHEMIVEDTGLGIERSRNLVLITVTSVQGPRHRSRPCSRPWSRNSSRSAGSIPKMS